jgi:heme/copper-type cytochrome/quinol oxidase subunit 2
MNHPGRALRTLITAICAISTLVALWQFYLFVQFRNATGGVDPQGGTSNLWLAVVATLIACVTGAYIVFSAVTHDKEDVMHITS